ncbi:MAG: dTDP-4-dehydrorhamnose 3,5-epimerase [Pseudomonadaceae bacterium]|nr:dTDP-4-dehydrorhamnose 3,5-epimerase [Pseudomonadaceae bacterium]
MKVLETILAGVKIIEPQVFGDHRGFFKETYSAKRYQALLGIELPFVQDNHSRSRKGVLRGLHFQKTKPQGKLVGVTRGAVYDVAADINPESPTYGQYVGVELSEDNHRQLWVPPGYAHGFCVLSDEVDFVYKCTDYYDPSDEGGVAWDCPLLNIQWPLSQVQLSEKDRHYSGLKQR